MHVVRHGCAHGASTPKKQAFLWTHSLIKLPRTSSVEINRRFFPITFIFFPSATNAVSCHIVSDIDTRIKEKIEKDDVSISIAISLHRTMKLC